MKKLLTLTIVLTVVFAALAAAEAQWNGGSIFDPPVYSSQGHPGYPGPGIGAGTGIGAGAGACLGALSHRDTKRSAAVAIGCSAFAGGVLGWWFVDRPAAAQAAWEATQPREVCQWSYNHTGEYQWSCQGAAGPRPHPGTPQITFPAPPAPWYR